MLEMKDDATSARARRFHHLTVAHVIRETADAVSLVLAVPDELQAQYAYRAGQFLTFKILMDDEEHYRSYSMSSAPGLGEPLQVTVKRIPGGLVSSWLVSRARAGDEVQVSLPSGSFTLRDSGRDLVALAGGSGITPLLSLAKCVLATTPHTVRLFYANRDVRGVIFDSEIRALEQKHNKRLRVTHHLDSEHGLVTEQRISEFVASGSAEHFLCGPDAFMSVVERALHQAGVPPERIRVERFGGRTAPTPGTTAPGATVPGVIAPGAAGASTTVTVRLGRKTRSGQHRAGASILRTARALGLKPPSSCESGTCATCIARVTEGAVEMRNNEILTPDEVEEGWVLTCQAVPVTPSVGVVYE